MAEIKGALVLVTNGVYDAGGQIVHDALTNRVAVTKPITVMSVEGASHTMIVGQGPLGDAAVRCVYVGTNAVVSGFTLTNGHTRTDFFSEDGDGGGAWCESSAILTNCVISRNSAYSRGGGANGGMLNGCTLTGNFAKGYGGAASEGTLNNCALIGQYLRKGWGRSEWWYVEQLHVDRQLLWQ